MANEQAKFLNSRRRHKTDVAIARQVKIAKSHGSFNQQNIKQKHRLAKHHAMDCGNPKCYLCGNPRVTHKDRLTAQEKRLFQDLDKSTDKHSNGLSPSND
jgi:hypothetical protein